MTDEEIQAVVEKDYYYSKPDDWPVGIMPFWRGDLETGHLE
jgi:hypothetical protein